MGRAVARLADRHGARRAALGGILANVALYTAFIPTAVAADSTWVYWAFSFGFGSARPFVDNAVHILVVETSQEVAIERTNGVLSTGQSLGGIAGPSLAGALFAWSRISPIVGAIVCACAALICVARISGSAQPEPTEARTTGTSRALLRANRVALALSVSGFLSNVFAGCYSAVLPLYLLRVVQLPPQVYGLNSTISLLLACTAFYGIGLGGWNSSTSSALLRSAHGPGGHGITTMYRSIVFAGAPLGSGLGALMGSFSPAWGVFTAGVGTAACGCVLAVMAGGDVGARVHC